MANTENVAENVIEEIANNDSFIDRIPTEGKYAIIAGASVIATGLMIKAAPKVKMAVKGAGQWISKKIHKQSDVECESDEE